ncbi:MAG TPA: phage portal protein, partial [Candidatus Kapabacteria bacterium]
MQTFNEWVKQGQASLAKASYPATRELMRPATPQETKNVNTLTTSRRHPMAPPNGDEHGKLSLLSTSEVLPAIERMMKAEAKLEKYLEDYPAINTVLIDRLGAAVSPFDPYVLLTLVDNSGYLSAALTAKCAVTVGQGYDGDPELLAHLQMANENETFQDVLDQWALDIEIYGNSYIDTVRTAQTANFYNVAALLTRVKPLRGTNYKEFVHYAYGLGMLLASTVEEFMPTNNRGVRQFKLSTRRGNRYYGDPSWISAKKALVINYDILSLAEKFFENSFMGDKMMVIKGADYTDDDVENMRNYLMHMGQGIDNAHKLLVLQVGPNEDVTMNSLNVDIKDASFQPLRADNKEEIVAASSVPLSIVGVATPSKLGDTTSIRESLRLFKVTYANGRQKKYEAWWQNLFRDAGLPKWDTFRLKQIDTLLEDSDIPQLAQAVSAGFMTAEEAQEQLNSE